MIAMFAPFRHFLVNGKKHIISNHAGIELKFIFIQCNAITLIFYFIEIEKAILKEIYLLFA